LLASPCLGCSVRGACDSGVTISSDVLNLSRHMPAPPDPLPSKPLALRPPSIDLIASVLVRGGGWRNTIKLASFVFDWVMLEGELGREVGIEEFGQSWSERNRRTAYRRLAEFRKAFPECSTPHDLGQWVEAPSQSESDRAATRSLSKPIARVWEPTGHGPP
jgi:hypothetical protein